MFAPGFTLPGLCTCCNIVNAISRGSTLPMSWDLPFQSVVIRTHDKCLVAVKQV